ncbi:unnamed protein product, partial [Prunus brigantina]
PPISFLSPSAAETSLIEDIISLSQTSSPSAFLSLILFARGSIYPNPLCTKPLLRQTSLSTSASLSLHFSLSRHLSRSPSQI